jgi:hypothetical protein
MSESISTVMIPPREGHVSADDRRELRRSGSAGTDLALPMKREELAQSRFALREQAQGRGYTAGEVRRIETACNLATLLFDGLYRADGRPFLNHVIGAASGLVRYEIDTPIVQAAILHAAFNHRPDWVSEDELMAMLCGAEDVVRLIDAQPRVRALIKQDSVDIESLTMVEAGAVAIVTANDVDMRLAGEYRASGRSEDFTPAGLDRISEILARFGIDGLPASTRLPSGACEVWPLFEGVHPSSSFRVDARNGIVLPA